MENQIKSSVPNFESRWGGLNEHEKKAANEIFNMVTNALIEDGKVSFMPNTGTAIPLSSDGKELNLHEMGYYSYVHEKTNEVLKGMPNPKIDALFSSLSIEEVLEKITENQDLKYRG